MPQQHPAQVRPAPAPPYREPAGLLALLVVAGFAALALGRFWLADWGQHHPAAQAWVTVFVSITLQSLPFLLLGVTLGAVISVLVPARWLQAALPRRQALAVPVAGAAGVVLPGCECASVPVAGALMRQGLPAAPALAFLLAAPAVNPIVLVATAVAFPGRPEMMVARLVASLLAATAMGWLWLRFGRPEWLRLPSLNQDAHQHGRASAFAQAMQHDLLHAGGFLVLGAMLAATVNVLVPTDWLATLGGQVVVSVIVLSLLAVAVAICSEADAFVAASFTQFSPTAMLAFMVVGPMVDVKLASMQAGTFGRAFAARFAPATFVVAVACAVAIGTVLL
ncbi:permease [Kineosporia babensis]|uniref:Permease n=1 Tax=Kineosporia babensis TaxID=499548 RepID=A0A9X1ND80_9ACTN|nr:permease [Kineosporia babensis]MCD5311963.1 permease [Kineosporia babensis]